MDKNKKELKSILLASALDLYNHMNRYNRPKESMEPKRLIRLLAKRLECTLPYQNTNKYIVQNLMALNKNV